MRETTSWNSKLLAAVAASCLLAPSIVVGAEDEAAVDDIEADVEEADVEADDPDLDEEADVEDEDDPEEYEDDRDWSLGGGMMMMVGQGTFVSPANDTEFSDDVHDGSGAFNLAMLNIGVNAGYEWDDFEFEGSIGYTQALTPAGGRTEPYEGRIQDLELGAEHDGWEISDTGVEISPSFGLDLPTSTESRTMTMLASASAGVGVSRMFFDSLMLGYSIGGSRTFHQYTSAVLDEDDIQDDEFSSPLYRPDGSEDIGGGRFAVSGINTQWSMSHSLSAMVMFSPQVQLMVDYSINTGWSYPVVDEEDEFTHDRQCVGRCASQRTSGMVMLNYEISENLGATGGIRTMQPPKTMDNKSFAFPFWDFTREASNRSMMTVGINGRY